MKKILFALFIVMFFAGYALADEMLIKVNLVTEQGIGKNIGTVTATDSQYGLVLTPQLSDLSPGKHEGPYGKGHLGDLPALYVGADGKATMPVVSPRLKVSDLKGRSLMIHAGSDNYSDYPEPLGGGGARVACGVIQ